MEINRATDSSCDYLQQSQAVIRTIFHSHEPDFRLSGHSRVSTFQPFRLLESFKAHESRDLLFTVNSQRPSLSSV